jgi:hypothetical protein
MKISEKTVRHTSNRTLNIRTILIHTEKVVLQESASYEGSTFQVSFGAQD